MWACRDIKNIQTGKNTKNRCYYHFKNCHFFLKIVSNALESSMLQRYRTQKNILLSAPRKYLFCWILPPSPPPQVQWDCATTKTQQAFWTNYTLTIALLISLQSTYPSDTWRNQVNIPSWLRYLRNSFYSRLTAK